MWASAFGVFGSRGERAVKALLSLGGSSPEPVRGAARREELGVSPRFLPRQRR